MEITSGYKVLAPKDIKKGLKTCNEVHAWGYVVACCARTGTPGELGEALWFDDSETSGHIECRTAATAHRKAQKRIEAKLKALGIGKYRQKKYIFSSRVWRY